MAPCTTQPLHLLLLMVATIYLLPEWALGIGITAGDVSPHTLFLAPQPGSSTSLLDALKNQTINTIVITSNYTLEHTASMHDAPPVQVNRNVTIQGLAGSYPILDLNFGDGLVELCSNCTVAIQSLTLTRDRRGSGPTIDLFLGKPGSKVILESVVRVKIACNPRAASLRTIRSTPVSVSIKHVPGPQLINVVNASFQGKAYGDALYFQDVTMDVPWTIIEGQGPIGGYSLGCFNTTMICKNTIDQACLERKGPDQCIDDMIDAVIHEDPTTTTATQAASRRAGALLAAIIVPAVLAVLLAVVAVLVWTRSHKRKKLIQDLEEKAKAIAVDGTGPPGSSGNGGSGGGVLKSAPCIGGPRAVRCGWEVVNSLTSPLMGPVQDNSIEFGEPLGRGSYAQVYKAQWNGRDVAVKVIEHAANTISAVEQELALMFSFNHRNILRGFYYITYVGSSTSSTAGNASDCNTTPVGSSAVHGSSSSSKGGMGAGSQGLGSKDPSQNPGSKNLAAAADGDTCATSSQQQQQQQEENSGSAARNDNCSSNPALSTSSPDTAAAAGNTTTTNTAFTSSMREPQRAETHLVIELCDCTLTEYMARQGQLQLQLQQGDTQELLQLLQLLLDVARGIGVLHDANVVHADLNGRNVLVSCNSSSACGVVAKVSDLGLSRVIDEQRTHRTTNTIGTMSHMPPELLRTGKMSAAADIYAFGILMWELYTGQAAFHKLQYWQFFETVALHGLRPLVPQGMPADYQLLMEHCWQTDPANRPTAARVLECLRVMVDERKNTSSNGTAVAAAGPDRQYKVAAAAAAGGAYMSSSSYTTYDFLPNLRAWSFGKRSQPQLICDQQSKLQFDLQQVVVSDPSAAESASPGTPAAGFQLWRRPKTSACAGDDDVKPASRGPSRSGGSWLKNLQDMSWSKLREHSSKLSLRDGSASKLWDPTSWFV